MYLNLLGMELIINHTRKIFEILPPNLEVLLAMELPGKKKGIAIALNNRIIRCLPGQKLPLKIKIQF